MARFVPRPIISTLPGLNSRNLPQELLVKKRWVCVILGRHGKLKPIDSLGYETDEIHLDEANDAILIAEKSDCRRRKLAYYYEDEHGQPSLTSIRIRSVYDYRTDDLKPWAKLVKESLEPLTYMQWFRESNMIEFLCYDRYGPKYDSETIKSIAGRKIEVVWGTRLNLMTGGEDCQDPIGDFQETYECLKRLLPQISNRYRAVNTDPLEAPDTRTSRLKRAAELLGSVHPLCGESLLRDETWRRAILKISNLHLSAEEKIEVLTQWSKSKGIPNPDSPLSDLLRKFGTTSVSNPGASRIYNS